MNNTKFVYELLDSTEKNPTVILSVCILDAGNNRREETGSERISKCWQNWGNKDLLKDILKAKGQIDMHLIGLSTGFVRIEGKKSRNDNH